MRSAVKPPTPTSPLMSALFEGNQFCVPLYQRGYAWGIPEIEDFWTDLMYVFQGKMDQHFFGQIVTLESDNDKHEIIDGQQRITTSLLFLSAFRSVCEELNENAFDGNNIDSRAQLLNVIEGINDIIGEEEDASLVVQKHTDFELNIQEYFEKITSKKKIDTKEKIISSRPKENMRIAYNHFVKLIKEELKSRSQLSDQLSFLKDTYKAFTGKFYVVIISTRNRRNAFTIFETLNCRGKDLTSADIIKNHVMSLMNDDLDTANDYWNDMAATLGNDSKKITKYIRSYWAASRRVEVEDKLYRSISGVVTKDSEASDFLKSLSELTPVYKVLLAPTATKANREYFGDKNVSEIIDIFKKLSCTLYYPIFLAMKYRKFSNKEIVIVMQKLLTIFIRHRTIINEGTNVLETGFSSVAKDIWTLKLKSISEINQRLNDRFMKSNDSVVASFTNLQKEGGNTGAKKWSLEYLLASIYDYDEDSGFNGSMYDDVFGKSKGNYDLLNISTEIKEEYRNYLGNWTIIESKIRVPEKLDLHKIIKILEASKLKENRRLAKLLRQNGWSNSDVIDRQGYLAKNINVIW